MKKLLPFITGIGFAISLSAQNQAPKEINNPNGSKYKECYWVKATKPFREIIAERKAKGLDKLVTLPHPAADGAAGEAFAKRANHPGMTNPPPDAALQSVKGHEPAAVMEILKDKTGWALTRRIPME